MKVAGIRMTDPWASRVLRSKGVETELVSGVPVETVVEMERVVIEHHGPEKNYRPLLHLTGELVAIRPAEELPHGVQEVTFRSGLGPTVDAFYEFDDVQLGQLVAKGYFTEGFEAPSNMAGIPWELPTTIDALVLAPEHEEDTPVVFVTVHGQTELALDLENSGYDLAEYFENRLTPEAQHERALAGAPGTVPTRSGEIDDLFTPDELDLPVAAVAGDTARRTSGDYPVVRASIFEALMAERGDQILAEPEAGSGDTAEEPAGPQGEVLRPEPEEDAEAIYLERIVPGVAQALAGPTEAPRQEPVAEAASDHGAEAPGEGTVLLDLYEEEGELDAVPPAAAPADETPLPRRRVQRAEAHERALEMDLAESDEPELG